MTNLRSDECWNSLQLLLVCDWGVDCNCVNTQANNTVGYDDTWSQLSEGAECNSDETSGIASAAAAVVESSMAAAGNNCIVYRNKRSACRQVRHSVHGSMSYSHHTVTDTLGLRRRRVDLAWCRCRSIKVFEGLRWRVGYFYLFLASVVINTLTFALYMHGYV